jgi:hypothetical protein
MRRLNLPASIALAFILSTAAWAATTVYTPPAEPGVIYTVINFEQAAGRSLPTYVTLDWGAVHRTLIATPYGRCQNVTPAGFVLKLRHSSSSRAPLRITTKGKVIREPYQGELPLEVLHACYRIKTAGHG